MSPAEEGPGLFTQCWPAKEGMPTELPKDTIVGTGVCALMAEESCECRCRLKLAGSPLHFWAEEGMGR